MFTVKLIGIAPSTKGCDHTVKVLASAWQNTRWNAIWRRWLEPRWRIDYVVKTPSN